MLHPDDDNPLHSYPDPFLKSAFFRSFFIIFFCSSDMLESGKFLQSDFSVSNSLYWPAQAEQPLKCTWISWHRSSDWFPSSRIRWRFLMISRHLSLDILLSQRNGPVLIEPDHGKGLPWNGFFSLAGIVFFQPLLQIESGPVKPDLDR